MKKAKKLTQEQKLQEENRIFRGQIAELTENSLAKSKKILELARQKDELGEKMNHNNSVFEDLVAVKNREIERLMEIIRWQIKPEAALQKEKKEITGEDKVYGFPIIKRGCC